MSTHDHDHDHDPADPRRATTSAPASLEPEIEAMHAARGNEEDLDWALLLVGVLVVDGVSTAAARRHLRRAAEAVAQSGEGPDELFGTPVEFAAQMRADAAEAGEPIVDSTPDASWRDVPVVGFTVAAAISVLFFVVWLVRDGLTTEYSWGLLAGPVLMSLLGVGAMTLWERLLPRVSRLVAVLAAGAAFVVVVGGLAGWLVTGGGTETLFTGSTFWLLALAPVHAALAWLANRVLPEARPVATSSADPLDDDAWARELAGTLRLRMQLSDARIREIVREAQAHAADAGRPLAEEFGAPAGYASRFAKDGVAGKRRMAWFFTALAGLVVLTNVAGAVEDGGIDAWSVAQILLLVLVVGVSWREYRAAVRRRDAVAPGAGGR
ncbi:hypothetical protein ACIPJU_10270 [Micrococcus endophyticus]|uniref:hypothetical protein n=1 Tax=Micrococcus endophyticus TaxID=455343 RepID=UPI0037FFB350